VAAGDSTFFKRWGLRVFQDRWAYDGAAQGGKKVAFGNTWVVAAVVVKLPFCSSPVALPVLLRLWRGKGTASAVELAAEMLGKLTGAFPGRVGHGGRCRFPRGAAGHRRGHLDDPAAGQRGSVRAPGRRAAEARPAEGKEGPAGHLRGHRRLRCLG